MSRRTIIIGVGEDGRALIQSLRERLGEDSLKRWITILTQGEESEEGFIVKGENPLELREEFASRAEKFLGQLGLYYQFFLRKDRNINSLRYLLLCSLYDALGVSLPLKLAEVIHHFHQEVTSIACVVEVFLILPPLEVSVEKKGWCYAFLKELDYIQSSEKSSLFDLIWLLSPDRLSSSTDEYLDYLSQAFKVYLSTEIYEDFNQQMIYASPRDNFLGKSTCYSSSGLYRLIFPADKWIELLGWRLSQDILSSDVLGPFRPTPQRAEMAAKEVSHFVEERKIGEMIKVLTSQGRLKGIEEPMRVLLAEVKDIKQLLHRFNDKLDLLTQRGKEDVWEARGIEEYIKSFGEKLRSNCEEMMDKEFHGPFSTCAFIALLMRQEGVYADVLKELEKKGEELPFLINLSSYLLGWRKEQLSENLEIIFREVKRELKQIYHRRFIPWKEFSQWEEFHKELQNVTALDGFQGIFGEDSGRLRELCRLAQTITKAKKRPYNDPLTPSHIKEILNILEKEDRKVLEKVLEEIKSIEDRFLDIEEKVKRLGWKRVLPRNRPTLTKRKKIIRERISIREKLLQKAEVLIQKRERLTPSYLFLCLYQELVEGTRSVQEEVEGFCLALEEERRKLDLLIKGARFPNDPITYQIVQKEEKDISSLYHYYFQQKDIPKILDELYHFLDPLSKPSLFYQKRNKDRFLAGLRAFAQGKFLWLREWNVEKVLLHFDRVGEALNVLETSCSPILGLRRFPQDKVKECLYVGLENEKATKISQRPYNQYLQSSHQFYTTGEKHNLWGLKITHGFSLFAVEGMAHLHRCYEKLAEKGIKLHPEEFKGLKEVILKEEESS